MATEKQMQFTIKQGMNQDILKSYPDNYFDSIVTDPPYGIEFLGKDWDKNTGAIETWEECFRVLKPGGHLLAFSAARTYHHLATNIESVGFEIRDQLMWLYGSGFPKAQDIGKAIDKRMGKQDPNYGTDKTSVGVPLEGEYKGGQRCNVCNKTIGTWIKDCKEQDCGMKYNPQTELGQQWAGWKTALKPAHEPIVMARKPFKGSTIDNVLEHGVGALNIDESRIESESRMVLTRKEGHNATLTFDGSKESDHKDTSDAYEMKEHGGRFPANVLGEIPEYQKYFYCPKVSRKERHIGFEKMPEPVFGDVKGCYDDGKRFAEKHQDLKSTGNNHPTVKPVELMKYLVKLVTPSGGKVLDPFNGSGSTGMACVELGYEYVGCELDPNYVEIANRRIAAWYEHTKPNNNFGELFE